MTGTKASFFSWFYLPKRRQKPFQKQGIFKIDSFLIPLAKIAIHSGSSNLSLALSGTSCQRSASPRFGLAL